MWLLDGRLCAQADLALAITLQSMRTTAPNLRLLVMSATLEDELIASLKEHVTATLGLEAPPRCVMSFKKPHPVTIEWMPFEVRRYTERRPRAS